MHSNTLIKLIVLFPSLINARAIEPPQARELAPSPRPIYDDNEFTANGVANNTLMKRAKGDANDPIDVNFNCASTPDICEIDCFCILCCE